jgi:hypothetical protein
VHAVTDLVFLGLNPVNGWFKSVSMDSFYPSPSLMHGYIAGQREVIENGTLLDVLGINMVLATVPEAPSGTDLVRIERVADTTPELVLLANPDAWPRAVLLQADADRVVLPVREGCSHQAALCRDYTRLADERLPDHVSLTSSDGRYVASMRSSDRERLLFISAMYRPEWQARTSAGQLAVEPIAGAFLGVRISPGVESVELEFVPRVRTALAWFSGLMLFLLLTAFLAVSWQSRRSRVSATAMPATHAVDKSRALVAARPGAPL